MLQTGSSSYKGEVFMKRRVWIVGLAVVVLALAAGGVAWAADQEKAPAHPQVPIVRGTVTAVEGAEISIETAAGEADSLLITDDTTLWLPGEPPTTTVELEVGDPVLAFGRRATSGGSEALEVRLVVVASDEELPKVHIRGRAVAVTQQTLVVGTGRRERAITVAPHTRFWSPGGRIESLRDVRPGDQILALGQPTELGQWIGGLVAVVGGQPQQQRGVQGEVTAIDLAAGTLVVQTPRGEAITVLTADETRYRIPGVDDPGLPDLKVGDRIQAVGRFDPEADLFLARGIGVLPPPGEGKQPPPGRQGSEDA
jgi:RNase P/RNase MRP subunit p29